MDAEAEVPLDLVIICDLEAVSGPGLKAMSRNFQKMPDLQDLCCSRAREVDAIPGAFPVQLVSVG